VHTRHRRAWCVTGLATGMAVPAVFSWSGVSVIESDAELMSRPLYNPQWNIRAV
jgi:hypothetical protein